MCSEIHHLSNCHGEWGYALLALGPVALWWRRARFSVRMWWAERKVKK